MPQFKSVADLCSYLQKAVDSALTNEVFETVKEVEQSTIQEEVYNKYTPQNYKRRRYDGGLIADENIVIDGNTAKNGILIVKNITPPNPYLNGVSGAKSTTPEDSTTPYLVEYGVYNPNGYGYDYWKKPRKRPFVARTIDELQTSGACKVALKNGLKRQGITVR